MSEEKPESRDELIRYLEQLSGRTIRTREDIRAYVEEISTRNAAGDRSVRGWQKAKQATLLAVAAFAFLQYYVLDVFLQILSLNQLTVFVPASTKVLKSALQALHALA